MEDQSLHSTTYPHFFQPLLPGFHTHLNIPIAFFSKHVQGRNDHDHIKIAKLRSDASDQTWLVKMDGMKLTDGWEDFVVAHALRVGDIVVFRHEGEMVFHVTPLGPSCCEIQYTSSLSHNLNDETNNFATGNSSREMRKRVKKNTRKKVESSLNHSSFVTNVTVRNLRDDQLYIPRRFARSNGLDKMSGKKIVLCNEEGVSWNLKLRYNKARQTLAKHGWKGFRIANGMKRGQYTFKLVQKPGPPVIRLCRAEHRPESESKSSSHHACYAGSVRPSSLTSDRLYLGKDFVSANGLDKGCNEIVLKNECGRRWNLALKHYRSLNQTFIGPGWKTFCQANGIKVGDSFRFKLDATGKKPVLSLCSADSNRDKTPLEAPEDSGDVNSISSNVTSKCQESEKERLGDKNTSKECLEMEKRKNFTRCSASSSYSQDRFVKLTLTPYAVNKYKLFLPLGFTRVNGLNKPVTVTLLGQDGVKWMVGLFRHKQSGIMQLGKGWRDFCGAQGVKLGDSFVLELLWEDDGSPVLKFCANLNSA